MNELTDPRLFHAASRGARIQARDALPAGGRANPDSGWYGTNHIWVHDSGHPYRFNRREVRIHPSDVSLQYGDISHYLRSAVALSFVHPVPRQLILNCLHNMSFVLSLRGGYVTPYGWDDEQLIYYALLLAEYLADAGM